MTPNEYGLIPVVALKAFDNWIEKQVFGVTPEQFKALTDRKFVQAYVPDEDKAEIPAAKPRK